MTATPMLSDPDRFALRRVAAFLSSTTDPWWVLGSAAMALSGIDPGGIRDVDVLVSKRDAKALMARYALKNSADGGTERYRSAIFLMLDLGERRVEIMAGYEIRAGDRWERVEPGTRDPVKIDEAVLFVPSVEDQIAILRQLGRPKDLARLARFPDASSA